nr:Maf family protein [uncultured Porphyromonas sp.]
MDRITQATATAHPLLQGLAGWRLLLGSQSPRRVELLGGLDLPFEQQVLPDIDESFPTTMPLPEIPAYIAGQKAAAYRSALDARTLLITADTLVFVDDEPLGKPRTREEAAAMLRRLSGRRHWVTTGLVFTTLSQQDSYSDTAAVDFAPLTEADISYYLEHYAPLDKAGAYGIQEWIGYRAIERIEGSFYTVMGLPVHLVSHYLSTFNKTLS